MQVSIDAKGVLSSGARFMGCYEPLCGCQKLNLSPAKAVSVFDAEPSLQPHRMLFKAKSHNLKTICFQVHWSNAL